MLRRFRDTLGALMGSLLGVCAIAAVVALPVLLGLWAGVALGARWAIDGQTRLYTTIAAAFDAATTLLPPWAWFMMVTLLWLAFLDVYVRTLVRDELSKQELRKD